MRDNEGSGFFIVEGLSDVTEYIHLGDWVIVAKDALEVSILDAVCSAKKNGDVYLELIK